MVEAPCITSAGRASRRVVKAERKCMMQLLPPTRKSESQRLPTGEMAALQGPHAPPQQGRRNSQPEIRQETAEQLGKRKRGRRESGLLEYQCRTMNSISELQNKLAKESEPGQRKRIKNQISAYQSRLFKRNAQEKMSLQIQLANLKVFKLLSIVQEVCAEPVRDLISQRFTDETATWDENCLAVALTMHEASQSEHSDAKN